MKYVQIPTRSSASELPSILTEQEVFDHLWNHHALYHDKESHETIYTINNNLDNIIPVSPSLPYSSFLESFIQHSIPKVDLHSHLNGSISNHLLYYLSSLKFGHGNPTSMVFAQAAGISNCSDGLTHQEDNIAASCNSRSNEKETNIVSISPSIGCKSANSEAKNYNDITKDITHPPCSKQLTSPQPTNPKDRMNLCFTVFDAIYKVMDSLRFTRVGVQDILFHYALERTFYLELRTSLRDGMDKVWCQRDSNNDATMSLINSEINHNRCIRAISEDSVANREDYLREVQLTIAQLQKGKVVSLVPPFDFIDTNTNDDEKRTRLNEDGVSHSPPSWFLQDFAPKAKDIYCRAGILGPTDLGAIFEPFQSSPGELNHYGEDGTEEDHNHKTCTPSGYPCSEGNLEVWKSFSALQWHVQHHMRVRLLVSLNRASAIEDMLDTLAVTERVLMTDQDVMLREGQCYLKEGGNGGDEGKYKYTYSSAPTSLFPYIVGIDLGGNAYKGNLGDILRLLDSHRGRPSLPIHQEYKSDKDAGSQEAGSPHLPLVSNLPHSIHAGEKDDSKELELTYQFNPERYGHLVFVPDETIKNGEIGREVNVLHPGTSSNPSLLSLIQKQPNRLHFPSLEGHRLHPCAKDCASYRESDNTKGTELQTRMGIGGVVEICLSSNMVTSGLTTVDDHHVDKWLNHIHHLVPSSFSSCGFISPLCNKRSKYEGGDDDAYNSIEYGQHVTINTDDRGVFSTSMTKELMLLSEHSNLFTPILHTKAPSYSSGEVDIKAMYSDVTAGHMSPTCEGCPIRDNVMIDKSSPPLVTNATAGDSHIKVRAAACFVLQRRALAVAFPTPLPNPARSARSALPHTAQYSTQTDDGNIDGSMSATPSYQWQLLRDYDLYCLDLGVS